MKKILYIILIVIIFFIENIGVNASIKINDLGQYYNDINGIDDFSGEYIDLFPGFFGNNFNKDLGIDLEYINPIGYYGNNNLNFDYNNVLKYIIPVGFFGNYRGQILDFGLNNNISHSSKINKNICKSPQQIQDIKIEVINDIYLDYIKLSWENEEKFSKIKVLRISKGTYEEILNGDITEYNDFYLNTDGEYKYFIISYNDCGAMTYSNIITINYEKMKNISYITLKNNKIYFNNFIGNNFKLKCFYKQEEILNKYVKNETIYNIDKKYENIFYSCFIEYYNELNELKISNTVYNIKQKNYLTLGELLNYLDLKKLTKDEIYSKYYYLLGCVDLEKKLNYEDLALFLVNHYGQILINDKDFSFNLLNQIGVYKKQKKKDDSVSFNDLIIMISKINNSNTFKQDLILNIDNVYNSNSQKIYNDLLRIYYINQELKKENILNYDKLEGCFLLKGCYDMDLYLSFNKKIDDLLNTKEIKNLGINLGENEILTWEKYTNILFKIISKNEFFDSNYTLNEYNNYINILSEAILFGENLDNIELTFSDYYNLKLELITNEKLFNSLKYLTKNHLKTINKIYKNMEDKSKLLSIIRDYLN